MLFKVTLSDQRAIFFHGENTDTNSVAWVSAIKFCTIWEPSERDGRSTEEWYIKKYRNAEVCFKQSLDVPVPLPRTGMIFDYVPGKRTLRMSDGITRIQWMIDHGVQFFPVLCPNCSLFELLKVTGSDEMKEVDMSHLHGHGLGNPGSARTG